MPFLRRLARTVGLALVTLAVVSVVTFLATNAVPADPARLALGRSATPDQLQEYRHQQGLDQPVAERYFTWLGNYLRGDWGSSTVSRRDVRSDVVPKLARTLILAGLALLIAIPVAVVVGLYTGQRSGSTSDVAASIVSLFLNSLPEFVIGLFVLMVLAVEWPVLPLESSGAAFATGVTRAKAYVLPVLTLAIVLAPYLVRMLRVNVRDVTGQPYVRSAVLRGLPQGLVTRRHIAPNASLPVVSVLALTIAELVGGLVVVEAVFGFPGVGKLLVDSVLSSDIPTVQAITLLICVCFVVLNLAADALLLLLDPRLRTRS
jgi:peptide/nickel transport system permease protein